ncbi:hypothetical protein U1Q18_043631 [Sarracenia purpurea var. burkii]
MSGLKQRIQHLKGLSPVMFEVRPSIAVNPFTEEMKNEIISKATSEDENGEKEEGYEVKTDDEEDSNGDEIFNDDIETLEIGEISGVDSFLISRTDDGGKRKNERHLWLTRFAPIQPCILIMNADIAEGRVINIKGNAVEQPQSWGLGNDHDLDLNLGISTTPSGDGPRDNETSGQKHFHPYTVHDPRRSNLKMNYPATITVGSPTLEGLPMTLEQSPLWTSVYPNFFLRRSVQDLRPVFLIRSLALSMYIFETTKYFTITVGFSNVY